MDYSKPNIEMYNVPWATDEFNGMPYRRMGNSGLRASNVGLGTWKIGYPETGDGSRVGEDEAMRIFDRAVELGVTFWDTANRYNAASGNSERIIGKWLASNPDQRRNLVIATKIFGGMDGRTPNHSRLSRLNIIESVYACIERLQTDYIDLLYFHAFDDTAPVEESLAAVEDLVRMDLVKYLGVSNFTPQQLSLYKSAAEGISVRTRVIAVQNQFNIIEGESSQHKGALDYAAQNKVAYIAWGPLAQGLLTDRYLKPQNIGPGDRLYDEGTEDKYKDALKMKKVKGLAELASKWGVKLSQLVLAYTLTLPGMGPVIPSASSVEQLEQNAAAGKIVLDDSQLKEIKALLKD